MKNKGVLVSLYSQEANKIVYDAIITGKIKELEGYSVHQREKQLMIQELIYTWLMKMRNVMLR